MVLDFEQLLDLYFSQRRLGYEAASMKVIELALAANPDDLWWKGELADALCRNARFIEAQNILDELAELASPEIDKLELRYGRLYEGMGRFDEAESWLRKNVAINPHSTGPRIYLGTFLSRRGRLFEAKQVLEGAIDTEGDVDEVYLNLGLVSRALGDFESAKAFFQRAHDISPDYLRAIEEMKDLIAAEGVMETLSSHLH